MKKGYKIILGLIVLLGFLIRVIGITDLDSGFYVDEASLGYNARSIWETGSDEYGQKLPLAFRSFGDFKSPLFVYLAMPLVSIFGEERGIRLTSAMLGVLTVWLVAEIARVLSGKRAGLLAGIILATLPWHVNLSRHGIEAVLAGALLAEAIFLITKNRYRSGLLLLALSTLAYHSTKYISPLLALLVAIKLWLDKKYTKGNRFNWMLVWVVWLGVLIINLQPFSNVRALGLHQEFSLRNILAAYMAYFSPRVLTMGDWQLRNSIYGISNVSILVVMFLYIGVWRVIKRYKKKTNNIGLVLVLATLVLAPLPAAATIDPFHSIRSLVMVIPLVILAGIGCDWMFTKIKKKYLGVVMVGVVFMIGCQTFFLSEKLFVQNKIISYEAWGGGYKQLIENVLKLDMSSYETIFIDTTDASAIYSLWQVFGEVSSKNKIALPLDTKYYQPIKWQGPESLTLGNGQNVYFKQVYWPEDQKKLNTLYIGSVWRFDPDAIKRAGAKVMVEIKDPTGKVVWMAVATKSKQD